MFLLNQLNSSTVVKLLKTSDVIYNQLYGCGFP